MRFWFRLKKRSTMLNTLLILISMVLVTADTGRSAETYSSPEASTPAVNLLLLDDSENTPPDNNLVTITGKFQAGYAGKSWFRRFFSSFPSPAYALDPNTVSKVVVFLTNGNYRTSKVVNGIFSLEVRKGSPGGMVFAGENDNYLGYLTLGNGVDSLPLHCDKNNVKIIDLGTLLESASMEGAFESGNNIFDDEIPLSLAEQHALASANRLFAGVVKNPDVNGNGVIDVLEDKCHALHLYYYLNFRGYNLYEI